MQLLTQPQHLLRSHTIQWYGAAAACCVESQAASRGPNVFSKVQVVAGDITQPGLGLSDEDRLELLSNVEVVIHSAAVLTLDAHIQDALR
jgi:hypothetical protein